MLQQALKLVTVNALDLIAGLCEFAAEKVDGWDA